MLIRLELADRRSITDDLREAVMKRTGVSLKPPNFWLDAWATGEVLITAGRWSGRYAKHSRVRVAMFDGHVGLLTRGVTPMTLRRGLTGRLDGGAFGLWCPGFRRPLRQRVIYITQGQDRWTLRNSTRLSFEIDDDAGRVLYRRRYQGRHQIREVDDSLTAEQLAVLLVVVLTPDITMVPTGRQVWGLF